MQANAALVETLVNALQGMRHAPTVSLPHFLSCPESLSDPTIDEWLSDFDVFVRQCGVLFVRQCGVLEGERAVVLIDYLGGCAEEEVLCHRMWFVGCSRWGRPWLNIAELSFGCINP